jgi:phenylalanyl-tRNA synthetase beta chain
VRIPLSWLGEYVELPKDVTPESVHESLVSVGLEEEDIHRFEVSGPIVVGEVLGFVEEPQSNGKTIRWCQVRVAEKDSKDSPAVRGIVCGASNFFEGDKVIVTLPGAVLPGPFPISARKTYGHVSDGMIASAKELGLGDDHSGIVRLSEWGIDVPVGTDAIELLGLNDVAIEVNVTPDRGYALSIRGIAREYHHATGAHFTDPASTVSPVVADGFPINLNDDAPIRGVPGCQVFVTRSVHGVDANAPTPAFIVSRLALAGVRSISLPVDITNYVMFELGQPIHGYDLDRLSGGITVRRAKKGEKLTTLDDQVRTLDPEDLLITDESGPIGLAGVMGGASTEIHDGTTNVLVEAAWFDPVSIARTQRRHKLPSEASKRFQRGVDPLIAEAAAQRVVDLLVTYAGGTAGDIGSRVILEGAGVVPAISFRPESVAGIAGIDVDDKTALKVLTDIGAQVDSSSLPWQVTPPSWRPDLTDEPTLVEEIARIVGFDSIPSVLPQAPSGWGLSASQKTRRRVVQGLAHYGLTEVLSYPFVKAEINETFGGVGLKRQVQVANALDPDVSMLRTSLVPGLVEIAQRNLSRGFTDIAIFEAGQVFIAGSTSGTSDIPVGGVKPDDLVLASLNDSLPRQPWWVSGLLTGTRAPRGVGQRSEGRGIADAIDAAKAAISLMGGHAQVRQGSHPAFHPGRTAEIVVGETAVGYAGELLPRLAHELDLPRRVAVFEIDGSAVMTAIGSAVTEIAPLSSYPAATQDLSLVVDATVPAGEVLAAVREGAGELLEHIGLTDEYRGEGIEAGKRSLTFALRFRGQDRTLTQAEATESKDAGVALAAKRFGAELRG